MDRDINKIIFALSYFKYHFAKTDEARADFDAAMEIIEQSAAELNKVGHWIEHDNGAWWECSECHSERAYGNEYCPDCGSHNGYIAKMEGVSE